MSSAKADAQNLLERLPDDISWDDIMVDNLPEFPLAGRAIPEAKDERVGERIFQNYRIIYRVEAERILILTVVHGARDLSLRRPKPWEAI